MAAEAPRESAHTASLNESALQLAMSAGSLARDTEKNRTEEAEERYFNALREARGNPLTTARIYGMRAASRMIAGFRMEDGSEAFRGAVLDVQKAVRELGALNGEVEVARAREAIEALATSMLAEPQVREAVFGITSSGEVRENTLIAPALDGENTLVVKDGAPAASPTEVGGHGWPLRSEYDRFKVGPAIDLGAIASDGVSRQVAEEGMTNIKPGHTFTAVINFHRRLRRNQQAQ